MLSILKKLSIIKEIILYPKPYKCILQDALRQYTTYLSSFTLFTSPNILKNILKYVTDDMYNIERLID